MAFLVDMAAVVVVVAHKIIHVMAVLEAVEVVAPVELAATQVDMVLEVALGVMAVPVVAAAPVKEHHIVMALKMVVLEELEVRVQMDKEPADFY